MKERNLKLMFHFKIPRGNFLIPCFPSDMNIMAKPRGVYVVWWQWWIYFALWGKKVPAAKLLQSFTPRSLSGCCCFPFLLSSFVSYFTYNQQEISPKAAQLPTVFSPGSHKSAAALPSPRCSSPGGSLLFTILVMFFCLSLACLQIIFP